MEMMKRTRLLILLLLSLLHICILGKKITCPSHPDKNLTCYSDYNRTITCAWHSPFKHDPSCTLYGRKDGYKFHSSCNLLPVDVSRPAHKKCSMVFLKGPEIFSYIHTLAIEVRCGSEEKNPVTSIDFRPYCQIKLDPPQKPVINGSTVTLSIGKKRHKLDKFIYNLQWKKEHESWTDASKQKNRETTKNDAWKGTAVLSSDSFIQGEKYDARVRVRAALTPEDGGISVWSEWSPSGSWVSHIGKIKQPPVLGDSVVTPAIVMCSVVLVLLLTILSLKRNKTIWVFLITKIKGQPIPNPALSSLKDVNFQSYLGPQLRAFFKPLEFASVEITTSVDDVYPIKPEAELPEKMRNESSYESTNSSFSNPSYAHVCLAPPPPVSLPTVAGNLDPCAPDTPYGPVCFQNGDKDAGQKREELKEKEALIREMFTKDCNKGEPVLEISDYEKVGKLQTERPRLQSSDSGVGSSEEVSQESLEADSINMTESHEENQEEGELEKEKGGFFQKLFGGSTDIFGKGSIQVCSGYEPVQKLQPDSPELQTLDANNETQGQSDEQESPEESNKSTESTNLLASPCSSSSVTAMSSNLCGPVLKPVLNCNILALMSSGRSMEPSCDGYMPVSQEQS